MAQKKWWKRGIGWAFGEFVGGIGMTVGAVEGAYVAIVKGEGFFETVKTRTYQWEDAGRKFGEDNAAEIVGTAFWLGGSMARSAANQAAAHKMEDYLRNKHGENRTPLPTKPDSPSSPKT